MAIKCIYNYKNTGFQVFYDTSSYEIVHCNAPIYYKNDFLNPANDATNDVAEHTEGTSNAIDISVATNGHTLIDTGTENDKRTGMSGELVWEAENEILWQMKLNTTTSDAEILLFAGVSDAKNEATGKMPFKDASHATGSIDAWADDAVGFGVRAETSDNIYAVSVSAAGTPQTTDTGLDLTLDTDYILEIVLNADGDAVYAINGAQVASHTSAVTATDPLTWFVGGLITTGSAAAYIDIDYVLMAQRRA